MGLTYTTLESRGLAGQPIEAVAGARVRINGRWFLSFASANYLGLSRHPQVVAAMSRAALTWGISLGTPRSLAIDSLTARLEQEIARLVHQDQALVFPSTTHIALDVLPLLAGPDGALFVDAWAYPISLEGVHAAAHRGARIYSFPHNDYRTLARRLQAVADIHPKVIVCDGVYPADGQPAALDEIARVARSFDAMVYVDDAHGIGILGERPTHEMPYGYGGGGAPQHFAVPPGNIVHVGSLSKAFGVPLAFVAGPSCFTEKLGTASSAHIHSSPPAIPVIAAALGTLNVHATCGELLRHRLADCVRQFRNSLAQIGIVLATKHLFPLQFIRLGNPQAAKVVVRELRQRGVWAVAQVKPFDHLSSGVLFVLTARHTEQDINHAVITISRTLGRPKSPSLIWEKGFSAQGIIAPRC